MNIDHRSVGEVNEALSEQSHLPSCLQRFVSTGSRDIIDQCGDDALRNK